jgi:competence protein ComEC
LFNAGFILSYGVVAALILLGPPIDGWLQARFAPDPFVPAELLPRWRRALQRPLRRLCQSLGVSTAAWVGLLPLMAVYFHLFSPVTVPANILVVPALSLITMVGGLSILVYPFWPGLAVVFNNANYFLLWLMLQAVEWLGRLPGGFWFVPAPAWWFVAAYYLALLALLAVKVERRWRLAVAGAGLAVCALGVTAAWLNRDTTVTVLDVDRGLAVFVDRPGTRHDVLVDAGDERDGARAVLPALRGAGVDSLGGGVVTRGVKAHAAGFGPVLAQVPVGAAWYPGGPRRSVYQGRWLELCQVANLKPATLRPGEAIALGRGARLWALDQAPGNARGRRAAVLVLMLEVDGRRVLLMSDTSPRVEDALLAASNDLRAAVVVRRVHGREPGFSEAFLDAVQPRAVVLVVSSQSAYHPNWSAVQRRLIAHGINVQRTVETGAVQLFARRGGWDVDPWLPEWPGGVGCGVRGEGE